MFFEKISHFCFSLDTVYYRIVNLEILACWHDFFIFIIYRNIVLSCPQFTFLRSPYYRVLGTIAQKVDNQLPVKNILDAALIFVCCRPK